MLSHVLRRAIAACASILLVLGFVGLTSAPSTAAIGDGTISGWVYKPNGQGAPGINIAVYRATGDAQHPWELLDREDESFYDMPVHTPNWSDAT